MDVKQAFEYAYETLSKPLLRDIDKTSDRQESVIIFLIKGLEAEVSQPFFLADTVEWKHIQLEDFFFTRFIFYSR